MAKESTKGVWKSGSGRGRVGPKGRQIEDTAWTQVQKLLGDQPRRRDLLIEFLHLIQDAYGHISAVHMRALAEEMRLMESLWDPKQTQWNQLEMKYTQFNSMRM